MRLRERRESRVQRGFVSLRSWGRPRCVEGDDVVEEAWVVRVSDCSGMAVSRRDLRLLGFVGECWALAVVVCTLTPATWVLGHSRSFSGAAPRFALATGFYLGGSGDGGE